MSRVVAMFGLSGVGKGWVAQEVCDRLPQVLHLEASALMQKALQTSSETLRTAPADTMGLNQLSLVAAFQAAREAEPERPILFDGHSIIDNDKSLIEIPVSVIAALAPDHIVFVMDEPDVIACRRSNDHRTRPLRTLSELSDHQTRARAVAVDYAVSQKVPFVEIRAGDWMSLKQLFDGADAAPQSA